MNHTNKSLWWQPIENTLWRLKSAFGTETTVQRPHMLIKGERSSSLRNRCLKKFRETGDSTESWSICGPDRVGLEIVVFSLYCSANVGAMTTVGKCCATRSRFRTERLTGTVRSSPTILLGWKVHSFTSKVYQYTLKGFRTFTFSS